MRVRPYLILPLAALLALCIYRAEVQLSEASARDSVDPGRGAGSRAAVAAGRRARGRGRRGPTC